MIQHMHTCFLSSTENGIKKKTVGDEERSSLVVQLYTREIPPVSGGIRFRQVASVGSQIIATPANWVTIDLVSLVCTIL